MGSKNSIVDKIIFYILQRHHKVNYFIDVFTGGFAVSDYVLQHTNKKVLANDFNKYVIALLDKTLKGELPDKIYDWVSRETFMDVKNNPDNYEDWYVGYILTIWSFGNSQQAYMYGKDIEQDKKNIHNIIVFNKFADEFKNFKKIIPEKIQKLDYKRHKEKRNKVLNVLKNYFNEKTLIENLQRTERLDRVQLYNKDWKRDKRLDMVQNLAQLERVQNLERLDMVQNLAQLDRVQLYNKDWKDFLKETPHEVLKDSIIYCDPPYEDTAEYMIDGFNHDEFWQWFRETPYCVYVSSYKAPDDIEPLNFEYKNQLLSGGVGKVATENIYWNGKGDYIPTMEDLLFNIKE